MAEPTLVDELWNRLMALDRHIKQMREEQSTIEEEQRILEGRMNALRVILEMEEAREEESDVRSL